MSRARQLLADCIAIPSVNPMGRSDQATQVLGETRYAQYVLDQLARLGIDATLLGDPARRSVMGVLTTQGALDTVLIASHLDTVPVDGMTISPFDPVIAQDRMFGRGSCDTKAGMAALLAAIEHIAQRGGLRRNVIIVGESDEEMASHGVREVLAALRSQTHRHPPVDWMIATEPTSMQLVTRHKGRVTLELVAAGRACHASQPEHGDNAIVAMARATLALSDLHMRLQSAPHPLLGPSTLSASVVHGGSAPNIVPDRARLIVDRRLLPGESVDSVREQVARTLREAGLPSVQIEACSLDKDALETPDDHPSVLACQGALRRCAKETVLGSTLATAAFGTDAGPFSAAGIPGVVLGPGSIEQAHTQDEWLPLSELEAMTRFFVALLTDREPSLADELRGSR